MDLARTLIILSLFFWVTTTPTGALELKSNVIILMDFSNSYFTKPRLKSIIPNNIGKITHVIAKKKYGPKRPTLIQVVAINKYSEAGEPVCQFLLLRKKLIGGFNKKKKCGPIDQELCSVKTSYFADYMSDQCMTIMSKIPEVDATDISGALSLASQIGESQTDKPKYLVIFSDMFEYRVNNLPVSKINLSNFHVLVVCGGQFNQEENSQKLCRGTEKIWAPKLSELGAKTVKYVNESGNWNLKAARDFFRNDR